MKVICNIGSGPRGLSVLERLCANVAARESPQPRIKVHVVDPYVLDGSAVWRTEQARELLMNTVASQITMFADDSVGCSGPVVVGPSLYEWARFVGLFGHVNDLPAWVEQEARQLGPDSYPSRAFYGHYLQWVQRLLLSTAPDNLEIEVHPLAAIALTDAVDGSQCVTLADGSVLDGLDAVILAQGHLPSVPGKREAVLADYAAGHGLDYVLPINPADVDLSFLAPDQPTALRGLGLNFFDYMALLTVGRGGRFTRDHRRRLVYHRSGAEPRLFAGSRRGVPYHARGENQKGTFGRHEPLFLTPSVIASMRARADGGEPVDFRTDLWPLIDREVRAVYYHALISERYCTCDARRFLQRFQTMQVEHSTQLDQLDPLRSAQSQTEAALLERFGIGPTDRWDWHAVAQPYGNRAFANPREYQDWLLPYLQSDISEAKRGNVRSPLKAALDVLRDLRNEIRLVVDHGGLSGDSYRDDLQGWYMPLNAFVSIGPPAQRIEELIALIECGVLTVIGPGMTVHTPADGAGFLVGSSCVPGCEVRVTTLIEARLPEPDIRLTADPLVADLLARGECHTHNIPIRGGGEYSTGGLAVTTRPYHLLGTSRRAHPRRFAFGVPTETVHWVTAAGIRPGVNSVILADADAVARASLAAIDLHSLAPACGM